MARSRTSPLPVRMDGYVRVSRVGKRHGPRFISPDVQRDAIVRWAGDHDVELLEIYEELDESGARRDRPLLTRVLQAIEAGRSDGMVVWRVDRFGRSLSDGTQIIERIRALGGNFCSVNDGLDISTDAGRLVLRILLSVAEYHLDGIRASWEAARERAIRRGVFITSNTIVGYRRTPSGRLRPDPRTAPVITEVYRRRMRGDSVTTLCRFLEDEEVRTGKGNPGWTNSTLTHMLRSRVYLGEVYSGRHVKGGAHVALTDPGTWQAAQKPLNIRRHDQRLALLVGVARCAGCAHGLTPFVLRSPGKEPRVYYRCRRHHAAGACPAPVLISAAKLEGYVTEVMFEILSKRRRAPANRLAEAQARAASAGEALVRYRDNDRIGQAIGPDAFAKGLLVRRDKLADANLAVASARARLGIHALPPVAEVRRTFPELPIAERRLFVPQVIDAVFVTKAHGPASHRVIVCPVGTAPRPLPRQGDKGRVLRTIAPRRGWINPVTPAAQPPANPHDEPWVCALVIAAHFAVERSTIYTWRQEGMPSATRGQQHRFRVSECQAWYDTRWPAGRDAEALSRHGRDARRVRHTATA